MNKEISLQTPNSLESVLKTLPEHIFQISNLRALRSLLLSISSIALGIYALYLFPWYLLPLGWLFVGTMGCGLFAVGYACSNQKFFSWAWLNDLVGWICMLPILYSFESWKRQHNKLKISKVWGKIVKSPFWVFGSIWEWLSTQVYFEKNGAVVLNAVVLYIFAGLCISLIIYFVGVWGLMKFYVIPLIVYHLWMSTFLRANEETKSQNNVICNFPSLIEFLTNYCNHSYAIRVEWKAEKQEEKPILQSIRDTITSKIPQYNLRRAIKQLEQKWGKQLKKTSLDLKMIKNILLNHEYPELDWIVSTFLIITPILALYGILTVPFNWKTYVLAFVTYYLGGIGITAGYHRLWSHRSYDAHWSVQIILLIMGSSAFEGSVFSWCADHRQHHRYTDTDKDPYNIKRSFFYAHMGWLFLKRKIDYGHIRHDLMKSKLLTFQDRYYPFIALFTGFFIPMFIAGYFWGDWKGGFLIGGVASKVFLMHCTFCINSLAHTLGSATYDDKRTPRDSVIVSLLTFGEGYHNFHHEFPYDYRNGLNFYDYDPGKWLIYILSWFGLTYNLKRFDPTLIKKGKLQMKQKQLDKLKAELDWGKPRELLPEITFKEFQKLCETNPMVIIDNTAIDVKDFIQKHPGGPNFIKQYIGKDVTKMFNGTVYDHSNAARNMLPLMHKYRIKFI